MRKCSHTHTLPHAVTHPHPYTPHDHCHYLCCSTTVAQLLNGSNVYAPDANGLTPLDMTVQEAPAGAQGAQLRVLLGAMMQDIIRGDY